MVIKRRKMKDLEDELADLLFTIVCIANDQNISLAEVYERKLEKLYRRENDCFKRK